MICRFKDIGSMHAGREIFMDCEEDCLKFTKIFNLRHHSDMEKIISEKCTD